MTLHMPHDTTPTIALLKTPKKLGRPRGSIKDASVKLSDRVRTKAVVNELLARTTCANNANQFARWFDETMRRRHPRLAWETERSGKWRKNILGDVSLNPESVDHLQELFPDSRYYATTESDRRGRPVVTIADHSVPVPEGAEPLARLSAREFYDDGPNQLWRALWEGASDSYGFSDPLRRLWEIYEPIGDFSEVWGAGCKFDDVLSNVEMKLYSNFDSGIPISKEDLGRSIVLYRLQYEGRAGVVANSDGVVAYLCVRLALADLSPWLRALDVFEEISTYVVHLELDRIRLDEGYRQALERAHCHDPAFDACGYVVNPFLSLSGAFPQLARRYDVLAGLSSY